MSEVEKMTVSKLATVVAERASTFYQEPLSNVTVLPHSLKVGTTELGLEEYGTDVLSQYLGIPKGFLAKVESSKLRQDILKHFMGRSSEALTMFEARDGLLEGAYGAERGILPRERVAEVISKVMDSKDLIRGFEVGQGAMNVDVSTGTKTVQPRKGDVTEGGLSFYSHVSPLPGQHQQPRVGAFLYRLACTNGMTHREDIGSIGLKGSTVDSIIAEMEEMAQILLRDVIPGRLEQFESLAHIDVPDPAQMIHRIARDNKINDKLQSQMTALVPELGATEAYPGRTLYDVVNLMNFQQHEETGVQRERLRELAGNVTASVEDHRCPACQKTLD